MYIDHDPAEDRNERQGKRADQYQVSMEIFVWAIVRLAVWIALIFLGTKLYNLIF